MNANNKVQEFARYSGMFTEVVRTLDKYGVGIMQMPCPEVLHIGCQRWWHSRNLYDNAGFRHCCRKLAEQMVDYMENYAIVGYDGGGGGGAAPPRGGLFPALTSTGGGGPPPPCAACADSREFIRKSF